MFEQKVVSDDAPMDYSIKSGGEKSNLFVLFNLSAAGGGDRR